MRQVWGLRQRPHDEAPGGVTWGMVRALLASKLSREGSSNPVVEAEERIRRNPDESVQEAMRYAGYEWP